MGTWWGAAAGLLCLFIQGAHARDFEEQSLRVSREASAAVRELAIARDPLGEEAACRLAREPSAAKGGIQEAIELLGPCMKAVSARYGLRDRDIWLAAGLGTIDAATGELGIQILIGGERLAPGDTILKDLRRSLALRQDRLLGYPAKLIVL